MCMCVCVCNYVLLGVHVGAYVVTYIVHVWI